MASSRKVATNENISTYGAGGFGRDFTVLSTWEAASDLDLISAAQSEVLELYDDAASFDDFVKVSGATANSTYFRIIRPAGVKGQASWQGHDGTPNNGVYIHSTGDDIVFDSDEDNYQLQDLIIGYTRADQNNFSLRMEDPGTFQAAVGVIQHHADGGLSAGRGMMLAGEDNFFINCLVQDTDRFGYDPRPGSGLFVYLYNCCAINNGQDGFLSSNSDGTANIVLKNCLAYGNGGEDFETGGEFDETNSTNNASEDATAPGVNERINQTFTFRNAGSDDWHLDINDAGARDFGADLSADGDYAFDDDIDFRTRIAAWTWDIGFDEYFSPYPIMSDREPDALVFGNRIVR